MTAPPVERLARWLAPVVPASRLALVRIAVCLYACAWLGALGPDLLARTRLPPERFDPVGLAGPVGVVSPGALLIALVVVIGLGLLVAAGREGAGPSSGFLPSAGIVSATRAFMTLPGLKLTTVFSGTWT